MSSPGIKLYPHKGQNEYQDTRNYPTKGLGILSRAYLYSLLSEMPTPCLKIHRLQ